MSLQKLLVSIGVPVAIMILFGVSVYGYAVSVQTEALAHETSLNQVIRMEVSERAQYETGLIEQLGLAAVKSGKMAEIIKGALAGRFGDNPTQGNALFTAVSEAYPGTEGLSIYDKILPAIQSGREAIRNIQNLRIEKAQAYNYWRKAGIVRPRILAGMYPSRDLTFTNGGTKLYGEDALEMMSEPISTTATAEAFSSGKETPIKIQ